MKVQYDQIRLIPEGYTAKSTAPVAHSVLGTISNTTFDEVSELGKIVAWKIVKAISVSYFQISL